MITILVIKILIPQKLQRSIPYPAKSADHFPGNFHGLFVIPDLVRLDPFFYTPFGNRITASLYLLISYLVN